MSLINCLHISRRFMHFRFKPNMFKKQVTILSQFNQEIEDTMEKIRYNRKVKSRRNKAILSQTTNVLMKMNAGTFESLAEVNNISSGSPEQLVVRREGMSRSFLTTRMKILNTNFSRAVAEIFIADEEISKMVEEHKIRITQVRVTSNLRILHIYWVTENEDVKQAFESLNLNKGRIHELLIETQYINSVPWIVFVYDIQESNDQEIATRLERCKQDLLVNDERQQPKAVNDFQLNDEGKENLKLSDHISFKDPFEAVPVDDYCQKMLKLNPNDFYRQLRLRMPTEMSLKTFNLDYEELMNKVLHKLHRARAQHRLTSADLHAVGDHLPPLDLNQAVVNNSHVEYNTEERIKAIKKFVELNKKRRNRMELQIKRKILEEEIDRMDSYEQLRDKLQESMNELHKDVISTPDEANSDEFTTIS